MPPAAISTAHLDPLPVANGTITRHALRILRMWRANELQGRKDYLTQLQRLAYLDFVKDLPEQSEREQIIAIIRDVLGICDEEVQTIVAVEDAVFYEARDWPTRYTMFDDTVRPDTVVFGPGLNDFFHGHISDPADIFDIMSQFYDVTDYDDLSTLKTLAVPRNLLRLQVKEQPLFNTRGLDPSPDRTERDILLNLLGDGLPTVEVGQLLNAELLTFVGPTVSRSQAEVQMMVDSLLLGVSN